MRSCEYVFFIASGVGLSPLYCGHFSPIAPAPDDRWGWLWSNWWNEDWQGKPKYSEKTFPSATLSTTNPTWPDPGSNPARRCGKPATNRLSYGAAPGSGYCGGSTAVSLWFHVVTIVGDIPRFKCAQTAFLYVILTHCMYLLIILCLEASVLQASLYVVSRGKNVVWERKIWDFDGGGDGNFRNSSVFYRV
jgi:hypothetical protein